MAYSQGASDAEAALLKMLCKTKRKKDRRIFDPKLPKSLKIYVATSFPKWQDTCVQIVKGAYDEQSDKVDDVKVKELLAQKGLIKDKNVMPFIQASKVISHLPCFRALLTGHMCFLFFVDMHGAQTAFPRTLSFVEKEVLKEIMPPIKKSLVLVVDVEILSVEEALAKMDDEPIYTKNIIDSSDPGNPAFEYCRDSIL